MPAGWSAATSQRAGSTLGKVYYYHASSGVKQWEPPLPFDLLVQPAWISEHAPSIRHLDASPLQFHDGTDRETLELTGRELFDVAGIADGLKPRSDLGCTITYEDGSKKEIELLCRIDTLDELEYYRNGGILQYVLRNMLAVA